MHFHKATAVALATLLPFSMANFDIYFFKTQPLISGEKHFGISIYDGEPNCEAIEGGRFFDFKHDVSRGKLGARCEGRKGCSFDGPPHEIKALEMNFLNKPSHHFTIYNDDDYLLYGLDGEVYGQCLMDPGTPKTCGEGFMTTNAVRKFRCLSDITVKELLDN